MPEIALIYKLAFDMVIVGYTEEGHFHPLFFAQPDVLDKIVKAAERFKPIMEECQRMVREGAAIGAIKMFLDEMGQEMAVIE